VSECRDTQWGFPARTAKEKLQKKREEGASRHSLAHLPECNFRKRKERDYEGSIRLHTSVASGFLRGAQKPASVSPFSATFMQSGQIPCEKLLPVLAAT